MAAISSNRFYEGLCPPFVHEPRRDCFAVVKNGAKGEGLTALKPFRAGEIVFRFFGPVLREQTLFTLQKAPGVYVEDPLVMGKVLHACDPNMICNVIDQVFVATRAIAAGEYLTMDYETTEDELFRSFTCQCGSPKCRAVIKGRAYWAKADAA